MKNYAKTHGTTSYSNDRELAEVLAAISVVSRRLARKLTAVSNRNPGTEAECECPYLRQERKKRHETLRDQL